MDLSEKETMNDRHASAHSRRNSEHDDAVRHDMPNPRKGWASLERSDFEPKPSPTTAGAARANCHFAGAARSLLQTRSEV